MPRRAIALGAGDGRRHGYPGVEWRDRCVGAEGERDPGLEQAAQHKGTSRAPGPVTVGDIAVVEGVFWLHARHDTQPREPGDVFVAQQLSVFDAAERYITRLPMLFSGLFTSSEPFKGVEPFKGIEHKVVGFIADGVHGWADAGRVSALHPFE